MLLDNNFGDIFRGPFRNCVYLIGLGPAGGFAVDAIKRRIYHAAFFVPFVLRREPYSIPLSSYFLLNKPNEFSPESMLPQALLTFMQDKSQKQLLKPDIVIILGMDNQGERRIIEVLCEIFKPLEAPVICFLSGPSCPQKTAERMGDRFNNLLCV